MHKIVNSINNAFRYQKDCFKVKKNSKTILFLKCLVKSNIIRYFKEVYNPKTDSWQEIAVLPGCRRQHAGATYGNELFVCGGLDWDEVLDSLFSYNASEDRWRTLAPMMTPRADHNMVAHEEKLYIAGRFK